jgi:transaldolase/glucose-6-phosphate isomerase
MVNEMNYSLPPRLQVDLDRNGDTWTREARVSHIWAKDASVWTGTDEADWLGWLTN